MQFGKRRKLREEMRQFLQPELFNINISQNKYVALKLIILLHLFLDQFF